MSTNSEQVKNLLVNLGVEATRQNIDMVVQDLGLVIGPPELDTWWVDPETYWLYTPIIKRNGVDALAFKGDGSGPIDSSCTPWERLTQVRFVEHDSNWAPRLNREDVLAIVTKFMTDTPWGVDRNVAITEAIMNLAEQED